MKILALLLFLVAVSTASAGASCSKFAKKAIGCQIDGYKHVAFRGVLKEFCKNLRSELTSKNSFNQRQKLNKFDCSELGDNPFWYAERVLSSSSLKAWTDVDLSKMKACNLTSDSLAKTQVCYNFLPEFPEVEDKSKESMVLIFSGGRRTGMSKLVGLEKFLLEMLQERFNLYAFTVESYMYDSKGRKKVKRKIANLAKSMRRMLPGSRLAMIGYSYGGSHMVDTINNYFTRRSLESVQPDLLLLIDPDGALNTLDQLYLVPQAKSIVSFKGNYIVPRSKVEYIWRLLTQRMDRYPTIEGGQPLVLLRNADSQEIPVYQQNGVDLSTHNQVPYDLLNNTDENGNHIYLQKIENIFDQL